MEEKILKQRIIFRRLIQAFIILSVLVMAVAEINQENDLFWQIKMGEQIWETHTFPTTDPYNFSNPGAVWTLEEWLPAVSFYLIYSRFGPAGLILYKAVVIALIFWLFMILFNRLKVNLYLSSGVLLLAAMVNSRGIWTVFPSIFEYLFIVLTILMLEFYRDKKFRLIPFFLIFLSLLWVQSHASFFLLSGIIAAYLFGDWLVSFLKRRWAGYQPQGSAFEKRQQKSLLVVFLLSLVMPLISPNGYWLPLYPFRITFGRFTPYVSEYQRFWHVWNWNWVDFIHGFTLILIILMVFFFIISMKKLHPTDLFLGIFFTILALTAVRHVAIFALVALFLISRYLTVWFGEYRGFFKRSLLKDTILVLLIFVFVIFYKTQLVPFGFGWSEKGYPREAAELINKSDLSGNMFNHYNYGGYLIWKMPKYKVFIDGRLEMYQGQAGRDYLKIISAEKGYLDLLKKYQINFFISYLRDPIISALIDDPNWVCVYYDDNYIVLVKNNAANQAFLASYSAKGFEEEFKKKYKSSVAQARAEEFHNRGLEEIKKKNYEAALYFFQQAVLENPKFIVAHLNLAQAYLDVGLYSQAAYEYQAVLENEPGNEVARKNLERLEKLNEEFKIF